MKNVKEVKNEDGLYPWGAAEITDKWVLLHKQGLPKWAIFYRDKGRTLVVPCNMLKSHKRPVRRRISIKRRSNA